MKTAHRPHHERRRRLRRRPDKRDHDIRRILVALDSSAEGLAALDTAARLAARLEAELEGLYVEDEALLHMARAPLTRIVSMTSASQSLSAADMERSMRAQARAAHQALARASERRAVRWSFRTVRGQVSGEILAAAPGVDMVILGKANRRLARAKLGSTARTLWSQAPGAVLVGEHAAGEGAGEHPVICVYEGTPASDRAVAIAASIAGNGCCRLTLLLVGSSEDATRALEADAMTRLSPQGIAIKRLRVLLDRPGQLANTLWQEHGELIVLADDSALLGQGPAEKIIEELHLPVLLVRQPATL
ncbi:MAG: universal stress protein [Alphaproteobacteria bacterium]|jgi:nucleotide-binding universal stress UspA family protein|nr:hypothetical protein [Rhodospirillaceae bacterium]MDP6405444.1 universal stress protein [Alphaproteobacteria bacterium]MDP6621830.1 universal stress protein [Alphaproteobacteria bacterium]